MRKLFSFLGGVLALWICWGLYRFLVARMGSHEYS